MDLQNIDELNLPSKQKNQFAMFMALRRVCSNFPNEKETSLVEFTESVENLVRISELTLQELLGYSAKNALGNNGSNYILKTQRQNGNIYVWGTHVVNLLLNCRKATTLLYEDIGHTASYPGQLSREICKNIDSMFNTFNHSIGPDGQFKLSDEPWKKQ